jgi:hypothetical protein
MSTSCLGLDNVMTMSCYVTDVMECPALSGYPGTVLVRAPASNVVTLAARTLQRTVFPPERMDVGLALFGVEELV